MPGSQFSHGPDLGSPTSSLRTGEAPIVRTTSQKLTRGAIGVIAALALMIAMPAVAGAQGVNGSTGPTSDQYDPPVVQVNTSAGGSAEDPSNLGPLPFTGFDVVAMLGVALAVTGLGLALQRAVSKQPREID
jgi:F0F1-type ATP synthase membrane subunit c/vacuolar-type H+-ATPase subunit K